MGQNAEHELNKAMTAISTASSMKTTSHAPDVPPLISKKWLCVRYELQHPNGSMNYRRLYRLVLTPRVIAALGMTNEDVRRRDVKVFDAMTSDTLKRVLNL